MSPRTVAVSPMIYMMASPPSTTSNNQTPEAKTGMLADDVIDLKGTAVLGEPIVGIEVVTLDERGPGALQATQSPAPKPHPW